MKFISEDELDDLKRLYAQFIEQTDPIKYQEKKQIIGEILGTATAITVYTGLRSKAFGATTWVDTRDNKQFVLKTIARKETYGTKKFIEVIYTSTINGRLFSEKVHNKTNGDNIKVVHEFAKRIAFTRMRLEYSSDNATNFEGIY